MLKVKGADGCGKVEFVRDGHKPWRHNTGKVIIGRAYVPKPRPMNADTDAVAQGLLFGSYTPKYTGFFGKRLQAMGLL